MRGFFRPLVKGTAGVSGRFARRGKPAAISFVPSLQILEDRATPSQLGGTIGSPIFWYGGRPAPPGDAMPGFARVGTSGMRSASALAVTHSLEHAGAQTMATPFHQSTTLAGSGSGKIMIGL
jgi:hypothetical protein